MDEVFTRDVARRVGRLVVAAGLSIAVIAGIGAAAGAAPATPSAGPDGGRVAAQLKAISVRNFDMPIAELAALYRKIAKERGESYETVVAREAQHAIEAIQTDDGVSPQGSAPGAGVETR